MKKIMAHMMLILCAAMLLSSCSKNEVNNTYEGSNQIYLSIIGDNTTLVEGGDAELTVEVTLTKAVNEPVILKFALMNDDQGIVRLIQNPVTIGEGKNKGQFKVCSNGKNLLTVDTNFRIGMIEVPKGMKLSQELLFRVKPNPAIIALTEKQKTLLAHYKTKYQIDLMSWIGPVSCHTKVMSPTDGSTTPFAKAFTKEYSGQTVITLSDKATEDRPILKMTENPFGLTSYMEWVLQQETVFNDEYWHNPDAGPNYKIIMELLGWNKENPGVFTMMLDDIVLKDISKDTANLECKGEKITGGGDKTPTIPFVYSFSPWEKQKKLIAEGNEQAKELEEADGTANPDHYLMVWSVDENEVGDETYFIPPGGTIDFKAGKMTFQFSLSHSLASGYTRVYATFEKK